ncbi:BatD family protein [Pelagibaculum spongiae]|uniref:DUF7939 domain-containing protein n=1 Tax=Pelagibaculum spongiae TaxID=2080658 RepID=A0A2V1GQN3_9GAMM|nr:BatD family protein [Pelagibaculum spongiae]PVZ64310.1 hypothetical protein DC094_19795 [Pelagibaculum spongiae]
MVSRSINLLFLFGILLFCAQASAANPVASATADRSNITLGESLILTIRVEGEAIYGSNPDLSPLQNSFHLLGQNQSSEMRNINGKVSQQIRWQVTLEPKKAGIITIPAISIGNLTTRPSQIRVAMPDPALAGESRELFMTLESSTDKAWPGQQISLTLKVYSRVNLNRLQNGELSVDNATLEQIGEQTSYNTKIEGETYRVRQINYALFTEQAGILTIPELPLAAETGSRLRRGRVIRTSSPAFEIEVVEKPDNFPSDWWIASPELRFELNLPKQNDWQVGQAVTATLDLIGFGVKAEQLPPINWQPTEDFRAYPEPEQLDNFISDNLFTGRKQLKVALIPNKAGQLQLPELSIPFWNTQTGALDYARLAAKTVVINPATTVIAAPELPTKPSVEVRQFTISVFALLWPLTLLGWWFDRRRLKKRIGKSVMQTASNSHSLSINSANAYLKDLLQACRNGQPQQAYQALLVWLKQQNQFKNVNSLAELAAYDSEVAKEIARLQQVLYAANPLAENASWDGKQAEQIFKRCFTRADSKQNSPVLPPLYPEATSESRR